MEAVFIFLAMFSPWLYWLKRRFDLRGDVAGCTDQPGLLLLMIDPAYYRVTDLFRKFSRGFGQAKALYLLPIGKQYFTENVTVRSELHDSLCRRRSRRRLFSEVSRSAIA